MNIETSQQEIISFKKVEGHKGRKEPQRGMSLGYMCLKCDPEVPVNESKKGGRVSGGYWERGHVSILWGRQI